MVAPALNAAPATHLAILPCGWYPTPVGCAVGITLVGVPTTVPVFALDANEQLATNYTATVKITSSDFTATLPAQHTFTVADGSAFSFPITFNLLAPLYPANIHETVAATDASNRFSTTQTYYVTTVAQQRPPDPAPLLSALVRTLLALSVGAIALLTLRQMRSN
jgi:hypothetical protein